MAYERDVYLLIKSIFDNFIQENRIPLMHEPEGKARQQVRNDLRFTKRARHTHAAGQSWQIGWPRPCASDNDTSV